MHDFDPGPGVDVYQNITVPADTVLNVGLQWDEPFGGQGPGNDHDIVLVDATGNVYFAISANDNVTTREGWEVLQFENAAVLGHGEKFALIITYDDVDSQEPPATLLKTVIFGSASFDEHDTASSTLIGHANAAGANAVGAAFFAETPEFGVAPPEPEPFSSAGGTPILFNTNGTPRSTAEIRFKPEITAVDGVNTTFFFSDSYGNDGIDDFFGTSAAAPHAAAIAALLLEARPGATPQQIGSALQSSAIDMGIPGFDFDTGAGLVQADAAIAALQSTGQNFPPAADFDFSTSGLQVDFTDTSTDADGYIASWSWDFGDGDFSTAQSPGHSFATAGSYTVTLTVTDDAGDSDSIGQLITVSDVTGGTPPVAAFDYDCSNRECSFDASASSGTIDTYSWNFGDGSALATDTAVTTHAYASQGTYTISLVVIADGVTSTAASVSLRIKNRGSLSGTVSGESGGSGGGGSGGDTTASEKGRKKCTDGVDNDGDGLIDGSDPDCR
jgi:PKD repeat protein